MVKLLTDNPRYIMVDIGILTINPIVLLLLVLVMK